MNETDRNKKVMLKAYFEVTPSQALTLRAMFEYWNELASQGASRYVAFFCDGDGNFKPKIQISTDQQDDWPLSMLTNEMRKKAIREEDDGHRKYDFDRVAWMLRDEIA